MTFLEMQTAVYDDLSVSSTDTFYTVAYVKRAVNRAMRIVAGLHPWPHTERAMKRSSEANKEWYNIPENFKNDSIYLLSLDGEYYTILNWKDYLKYKDEQGANASEKYASTFRNRYFINPTPSADGSNNISIWGQEIPDDMVDDSDVSAFNGEAEIEEQIVEIAIAFCLMKGRGTNYSRGLERKTSAITFVEAIYDTINRRQALTKTQHTSAFPWRPIHPKNGSDRNRIGNFSY